MGRGKRPETGSGPSRQLLVQAGGVIATPEVRKRGKALVKQAEAAFRTDVESAALTFINTLSEEIDDRHLLVEVPVDAQGDFDNVRLAARRARRLARLSPVVQTGAVLADGVGIAAFLATSIVTGVALHRWPQFEPIVFEDIGEMKFPGYAGRFDSYEHMIGAFNTNVADWRRRVETSDMEEQYLLLNVTVPAGEMHSSRSQADKKNYNMRSRASFNMQRLCTESVRLAKEVASHATQTDTPTEPGKEQPVLDFIATRQKDGVHVHALVPISSLNILRLTPKEKLYAERRSSEDYEYHSGRPRPFLQMAIHGQSYTVPLEWVEVMTRDAVTRQIEGDVKRALLPSGKAQ